MSASQLIFSGYNPISDIGLMPRVSALIRLCHPSKQMILSDQTLWLLSNHNWVLYFHHSLSCPCKINFTVIARQLLVWKAFYITILSTLGDPLSYTVWKQKIKSSCSPAVCPQHNKTSWNLSMSEMWCSKFSAELDCASNGYWGTITIDA